MATIERGIPLVEQIIDRIKPHVSVEGADDVALDALESRVMVEIPPTLRRFLKYDFTFRSFGTNWAGKGRFGNDPKAPSPRITSVNKMAEAMTELGCTSARFRNRVIRLPNLKASPWWYCMYLGESRRDGELPILGLINDETSVHVFVRYTSFDLYLLEQSGLAELVDSERVYDLDHTLSANPELQNHVIGSDEDFESSTY